MLTAFVILCFWSKLCFNGGRKLLQFSSLRAEFRRLRDGTCTTVSVGV